MARRRSLRGRLLPVALLLVLGGLATWGLHGVGWDLSSIAQRRTFVEVEGEAVAVPLPDGSGGRELPAVPVTTSGSHAFLHVHPDGTPVGYDPCRPVRYVVNPVGAPEGGPAVLAEAVQVVQEATGLLLEPAGETDEGPALDRTLIQEDRYGPGWAPVLVVWSDEATVPELAGEVAGVGGSAAVPGARGEGRWLAAGRLVLDREDLGVLLQAPGGDEHARAIVVHELAHVLGLDHVDDPGELMHPTTSARTDLGPGDRQGLALLGQVPCEQ